MPHCIHGLRRSVLTNQRPIAQAQLHESRVRDQIDRLVKEQPFLARLTAIDLRRRAEAILRGEHPGAVIFPSQVREPERVR
jgi:hypothetical protein